MFKHDKYVRAWLDGETIEYQLFDGTWALHYGVCGDDINGMPAFPIDYIFRIKPKPLEGWVNVYSKDGGAEYIGGAIYSTKELANHCRINIDIIRTTKMREIQED